MASENHQKLQKFRSVQLMNRFRIFVRLQLVQVVPPNVQPFVVVEERKPWGELVRLPIDEHGRQLLARHPPHFAHLLCVWLNISGKIGEKAKKMK